MNNQRERLLTWVLVVAIVFSLSGVVYLSATPQQRTDPYTSFYVLGTDGNASEYPSELTVGDTGTVIVGISNHEHQTVEYTVVLQLGSETKESQTVSVESGETWEQRRSFTADSPGRKQLRIHLYRVGNIPADSEPYRTLSLWITVHPKDTGQRDAIAHHWYRP